MQIKKTNLKSYTVISLIGDMDTYDAEEFENQAFESIKNGQINIIINFEKLDYICSSGLRALLSIRAILLKQNGKLLLASMKDRVLEVFRISKLINVFDLFDNVEEAAKQ